MVTESAQIGLVTLANSLVELDDFLSEEFDPMLTEPIEEIILEPEKERCEALLITASPDLYRNNAFRLLGLPVDASIRQINRHIQQLSMTAKIGGKEFHRDWGVLPLYSTPEDHLIQQSLQRLKEPETRLVDEFFWFWPLGAGINHETDEFLEALKQGDFQQAVTLLKQYELDGRDAMVSSHNLAVLTHALALDIEHDYLPKATMKKYWGDNHNQWKKAYAKLKICLWKNAYNKWKKCLAHEDLWKRLRQRIRDIDDPRLTTGFVRRFRSSLPIALLSINTKLAVLAAEKGDKEDVDFHLHLLNTAGFHAECIEEALLNTTALIQDQIQMICKSAVKQVLQEPEKGREIFEQIIQQTEKPLVVLQQILLDGHPNLLAIRDVVALKLLECQTAYAEKTRDWPMVLQCLERAHPMAGSDSVRQKIESFSDCIKDSLEAVTCWFCRDQRANEGAAVHIQLKKLNAYSSLVHSVPESRKSEVIQVPRCERCRSIHKYIKRISLTGGTVCFMVCLSSCMLLVHNFGVAMVASWVFSVICFITGCSVCYQTGVDLTPKWIKPETAAKEYPVDNNNQAKNEDSPQPKQSSL